MSYDVILEKYCLVVIRVLLLILTAKQKFLAIVPDHFHHTLWA